PEFIVFFTLLIFHVEPNILSVGFSALISPFTILLILIPVVVYFSLNPRYVAYIMKLIECKEE
ncbi:MAG: hypothetical protein ACXQS8_03870, partial [Candidatus Helarchaeales archaeon]